MSQELYDTLKTLDQRAQAGDQQAAADARKLAAYLASTSAGVPGVPQPPVPAIHSQLQERKAQRRAEIETQTGAPFDPSAGVADFGQRFGIARGVSPESRALTVGQQNPGADVRVVNTPDGQEVVFRPQGEQSYRGVNPPGPDRGDLGAASSFVLNTENALTTAAAIATRGKSWPLRGLYSAFSAGTGRLIDEGIEKARGRNADPINELFGRAAMSFGLSGVMEPASSILARGTNSLRPGVGVIEPQPGVKAAQQAAKELNLPNLTTGQTHPLFARRENQVLQTSQPIQQRYGEQAAALRQVWDGERLPEQLTDSELDGVVSAWAADVGRFVKNPGRKLSEGGMDLKRGLNEFEDTSRAWVGRKYDRALTRLGENEGALQFNLDGVSRAVDEVLASPSLRLADGTDAQVRGSYTSELGEVIDLVKQVGDTPQGGRAGYDALVGLRSRLYNIKSQDWNSATPQQRNDIRAATKIYNALKDSIENPTLADGVTDEAFSRLWRAASRSNAWREDVLEIGHLSRLAKADDDAVPMLVEAYAKPGHGLELRTLHRVLPKERWQSFSDAYQTRLLSEPEKIPLAIETWRKDPDGLDLLIPKARQTELVTYGRAAQRIKAFESDLIEQGNLGRAAVSMIDGGRSQDVAAMVNRAGGINSREGQAIRAGIIESILVRSSRYDKATGQTIVDPRKFESLATELLDGNKVDGIFNATDIRRLKQSRDYAARIATSSDVGGSMAGAGTAGQAFDLFSLAKLPLAWLEVGANAISARAFISPRVQSYLTGTGRNLDRGGLATTIRAGGTVLSLIANDLSRKPEGREAAMAIPEWIDNKAEALQELESRYGN